MIRHYESEYKALLKRVIDHGEIRRGRNGTTKQLFGEVLRIESLASNRFPILTSRKLFYKGVLGELAAFLRGATLVEEFEKWGCNYWRANAEAWEYNEGKSLHGLYVGNIYGAKWRDFHGVDQLAELIARLKREPGSRRHVLTTYDPSETWQCLPPCHLLAQFNVVDFLDYIDCVVYMRSVDLVHGLPSDVILYAALLALVAEQVDKAPGTLIFMLGDTHIYKNHLPLLDRYLDAEMHDLPKFELNPDATIDTFVPGDLFLYNYQHGERIDFPFNV